MRRDDASGRPAAVVAVSGGLLVVIGAVLPWMSLFAGLERYSGMAGLYGRLAFAGGVLAILGGIAMALQPDGRIRAGLGALGALLALFACWIVLGLRSTTQALGRHPFLIARPGSGPYVVAAGALVVAALLLPRKWRT